MSTSVEFVSADTAQRWYETGEAVIVDVREPHEYAEVRIPGATLIPLSAFDPARLPPHAGKHLLFHCKSGVRCGMASQIAAASGESGPIYRLQGGIMAWIAAGGPVETG
ncbi:MAG: rhodanese-like domain-containing protein [Alphaproteobacteria bacterium]